MFVSLWILNFTTYRISVGGKSATRENMVDREEKIGIKTMILSKLNIEKAKIVAFVLVIGFVIHNTIYFQNRGKVSSLVM